MPENMIYLQICVSLFVYEIINDLTFQNLCTHTLTGYGYRNQFLVYLVVTSTYYLCIIIINLIINILEITGVGCMHKKYCSCELVEERWRIEWPLSKWKPYSPVGVYLQIILIFAPCNAFHLFNVACAFVITVNVFMV